MKDLMFINGCYRMIFITDNCLDEKCFKVQINWLGLFWITIKKFIINDVEDYEFCFNEAEELYDKLVDPYGTL